MGNQHAGKVVEVVTNFSSMSGWRFTQKSVIWECQVCLRKGRGPFGWSPKDAVGLCHKEATSGQERGAGFAGRRGGFGGPPYGGLEKQEPPI